jgi:hypothetical protein
MSFKSTAHSRTLYHVMQPGFRGGILKKKKKSQTKLQLAFFDHKNSPLLGYHKAFCLRKLAIPQNYNGKKIIR